MKIIMFMGEVGNYKHKIGEARLDGWKILMRKDDVLNALNDGIRFELKNISSHDSLLGIPGERLEVNDWLRGKVNSNLSVTIDSIDYLYFNIFPNHNSPRSIIELPIFNPTKDSGKIDLYRYRIQPQIFYHSPIESGDSVRIISEGNWGPQILQQVHNVHRLLSEYRKAPLVYLVNEDPSRIDRGKIKSSEFGKYMLFSDLVLMTAGNFINPEFENQAEVIGFHEVCHGVLQNIGIEKFETIAEGELEKTFLALREYAYVPTSPVFRIFGEYSYLTFSMDVLHGKTILNYSHQLLQPLDILEKNLFRNITGFLKTNKNW